MMWPSDHMRMKSASDFPVYISTLNTQSPLSFRNDQKLKSGVTWTAADENRRVEQIRGIVSSMFKKEDLVCLQEVTASMLHHLPEERYRLVEANQNIGGCAVIACNPKYEFISSVPVYQMYVHDDGTPVSKLTALMCKLRDTKTGEVFAVASVHIPFDIRQKQGVYAPEIYNPLYAAFQACGVPYGYLCGDFNWSVGRTLGFMNKAGFAVDRNLFDRPPGWFTKPWIDYGFLVKA